MRNFLTIDRFRRNRPRRNSTRFQGGFRGAFHLQGQARNRQVATDGLVAAGFRFGKVPVVENVIPLKPKLFGNTHFWLET